MTVKRRLNLSHRNVWKVLKNKVDLYNIYTAKAMRNEGGKGVTYYTYNVIYIKKKSTHKTTMLCIVTEICKFVLVCRHTFYVSTCIANAYINALIEGFLTEKPWLPLRSSGTRRSGDKRYRTYLLKPFARSLYSVNDFCN